MQIPSNRQPDPEPTNQRRAANQRRALNRSYNRYLRNDSQTPAIDLNWSDWNSLINGRLSDEERYTLTYLDKKIHQYPTRFPDPTHRTEASILILAARERRQSIAFCGFPSDRNRTGLCGRWKYCPYCAKLTQARRGRAFLVPLAQQLARGARLHWVTVSFDDHETFGLHYDIERTETVREVWQACSQGIRSLITDKQREGALICWELKVNRLVPDLRVLPHAHALVLCDAGTEDVKETLLREVARNLPEEANFLTPDIRVEELERDTSAMRRLFYMTKPFALADAYEKAARLVRDGQCSWQEVNTAATLIVEGFDEMTIEGHMFRPCGVFHHRSRSSIRIPRGEQVRYEAQFQEICERAPHEPDEPQNLGDDVLDEPQNHDEQS